MADSIAPEAFRGSLETYGTRQALAGFFISGLLLSFTGAILPAWGHHLTASYDTVGMYFLMLNAGILGSLRLAQWMLPKKGAAFVLSLASAIACGSILALAAASPPVTPAWRMPGLLGMGAAAGLMHSAMFEAISPVYEQDRLATMNLAGMLFGGGSLAMVLLVAGTFYVYTVPSILMLVAVIPGLFAGAYARMKYPLRALPQQLSILEGFRQFRSLTTVLLALLLFFQFGNEWAIAGWLPLYLVQRLGISPARSLHMLALYWVALLAGRIVAQSMLPRVSHVRLLFASAALAVFGALVLEFTDNAFGAVTGILMLGTAYAPIYPLVVEKIRNRFPGYHPGFFNGIFSFAFTGALLAPCSLGLFAEWWGIGVVMALPACGTLMVLLLVLAISVEARFADQGTRSVASP